MVNARLLQQFGVAPLPGRDRADRQGRRPSSPAGLSRLGAITVSRRRPHAHRAAAGHRRRGRPGRLSSPAARRVRRRDVPAGACVSAGTTMAVSIEVGDHITREPVRAQVQHRHHHQHGRRAARSIVGAGAAGAAQRHAPRCPGKLQLFFETIVRRSRSRSAGIPSPPRSQRGAAGRHDLHLHPDVQLALGHPERPPARVPAAAHSPTSTCRWPWGSSVVIWAIGAGIKRRGLRNYLRAPQRALPRAAADQHPRRADQADHAGATTLRQHLRRHRAASC